MKKRYDHQTEEPRIQAKWAQEQTYDRKKHPGKLYSIDTPPPTVSGSLHIGHIFSYTQTDILARYKRMAGFSVFYPFGFDDNGLPTERYVEKKLGIRSHEVGRSVFIQHCLAVTVEAEQEFQSLWQQMGISADWQMTYATISQSTRKISQESFIRLLKQGLAYRKFEPALYCTTCRTSVAQAELEDVEKPSHFNDIVFEVCSRSHPSTSSGRTERELSAAFTPEALEGLGRTEREPTSKKPDQSVRGEPVEPYEPKKNALKLPIGTTRPELLPSCVALLYHPDDTRYQHLQGASSVVPIFGQTVPIIADQLVDPQKGTGLVMCCAFGDKTDIHWIKQHALPQNLSIGPDGKFLSHAGPLAGMKVAEARKKILELLQAAELLANQKAITHTVNVHERCKKEIEYLTLSQWFLKTIAYKQEFLKLADSINWHPKFMKSRYKNWVENISWDWCLSRQRYFGIPFPVWHCADCNTVLLPELHDLPLDPQEMHYPGACTDCGSKNIVPDKDVMDTWNTSSLTPYICYELFNPQTPSPFEDQLSAEFLPMSMRPQAHDIIRTWAFYTIVKTWMHHKNIPWSDIVISGHVLSSDKEKLSKSKEQKRVAPENLLKQYAADAIRYWTASARLGHDVSFSETQLKIGQKLITKLWNAFRFVHEHVHSYQPTDTDTVPHNPGIVNEWLLHHVSACFTHYKKHLDTYEYSSALEVTERFFWHDFCDNYLELVKDQFFNPDNYTSEELEGTRWTLRSVGLRILQLYAPFLPHVTERIYQSVYQSDSRQSDDRPPSLHQTKFLEIQTTHTFEKASRIMQRIITIATTVRKLKTEHECSLKTELATLAIHIPEQNEREELKKQIPLLKGITKAHAITFIPEKLDTPMFTKDGDTFTANI